MDLFHPERLWVDDDNRESARVFEARIKAAVEALEVDSDGRKVLPLAHPVTMLFTSPGQPAREEQRSALYIRRPTGADIRAVNEGASGTKIVMDRFERLTGLTSKEADKIAESDIQRAMAVIENFT
jgi:hypothetical protein